MFAVIEDGSRQHRVQEGDLLSVDYRSDAEIGAALEFDHVLLANAGGASVIGKPVIAGASVGILSLHVFVTINIQNYGKLLKR